MQTAFCQFECAETYKVNVAEGVDGLSMICVAIMMNQLKDK